MIEGMQLCVFYGKYNPPALRMIIILVSQALHLLVYLVPEYSLSK